MQADLVTHPTLTSAQREDLFSCVRRHVLTIGSWAYPTGDAIRLRAGYRLAQLGLVALGNEYSANRYRRWKPTAVGIAVAVELGIDVSHELLGQTRHSQFADVVLDHHETVPPDHRGPCRCERCVPEGPRRAQALMTLSALGITSTSHPASTSQEISS